MFSPDRNSGVNMQEVNYLTELMNDREQLNAHPRVFKHIERLVDQGRFPKEPQSIFISRDRERAPAPLRHQLR